MEVLVLLKLEVNPSQKTDWEAICAEGEGRISTVSIYVCVQPKSWTVNDTWKLPVAL